MLTLYVIRHGQTDFNHNGTIQGQMNTKLNEVGEKQAQSLAKALEDVHFDLAFSSDLSRASDTATNVLSRQLDKIVMTEDVALRERDMGELQGKQGPVPRPLPASVESNNAFVKRIVDWFKTTILPLAKSDKDTTVLVSTHGAWILTLFRQLALPVEEGGLGYEVSPKVKSFEHCYNTALAITSIDNKGKGFISKFNDHRHVQVGTNVTAPVDLAA